MEHVDGNGTAIPALGLGTWTLRGAKATRLVAGAIEAGYRHFDTAVTYENEAAVGAGLRDVGIDRDQVFVTTKVRPSDIGAGDLQRSVEASLGRLGLEHIDLALIHWPSASIPLAESITALNDVAARGLARAIGVSNFPVALLEQAVALSARPLACNQIEYHPYLGQDRVLAACRRHGIAVVSYSPIAQAGDLFREASVQAAAAAHDKSPAQVVLRWQLQQPGVAAIPRSSNLERIAENIDIFGFALSADEMAAIHGLKARRLRLLDMGMSAAWDPA